MPTARETAQPVVLAWRRLPDTIAAMGVHEHHAKAKRHVGCAVLTISDSRTESTDTSGALLKELLATAGHQVMRYAIVPDEPSRIRELLAELTRDASIEAILLTGGTGV